MRKLSGLLLVALVSLSSFVVVDPKPTATPVMAKDVLIPLGKDGKTISLLDLTTIKRTELEQITGRKMNVLEKSTFGVSQKKLKKFINKDGSIDTKKLEKAKSAATTGAAGFHLGGFALGFFLSLIGVLIAYLINDDKKKSRTMWAWIGAAVGILLWLLIF
jgi:hypothetical protein